MGLSVIPPGGGGGGGDSKSFYPDVLAGVSATHPLWCMLKTIKIDPSWCWDRTKPHPYVRDFSPQASRGSQDPISRDLYG